MMRRAGRVGLVLGAGLLAGALTLATTGCNVAALEDLVEELEGLADDKLAGQEGGFRELNHMVAFQVALEEGHGLRPWGGDEERLVRWCTAWADTFEGPLDPNMIKGNYRKEDSPVLPDHQEAHYHNVHEAHLEAFRAVPLDHPLYAIMPYLLERIHESTYGWAEVLRASYSWSYQAALNDGATMRYYTIDHLGELATWKTPLTAFAERWCWEDPSWRGPQRADGFDDTEWDEAWDAWDLDDWLAYFDLAG
jgi:hypothetical protein